MATQRISRKKSEHNEVVFDKYIPWHPDLITSDDGTQIMAKSFQSNTNLRKIETLSVSVEAPHSTSVVERYPAPIRRNLKISTDDAGDFPDDEALQMAVRSFNDPADPERHILKLLVCRAILRLEVSEDVPSAENYERTAAPRKATTEMSTYFARHQV